MRFSDTVKDSEVETCMEIFPRFSRGYPREIPRVREQSVRENPREGNLVTLKPAVEGKVVEGNPAVKVTAGNSGCITLLYGRANSVQIGV